MGKHDREETRLRSHAGDRDGLDVGAAGAAPGRRPRTSRRGGRNQDALIAIERVETTLASALHAGSDVAAAIAAADVHAARVAFRAMDHSLAVVRERALTCGALAETSGSAAVRRLVDNLDAECARVETALAPLRAFEPPAGTPAPAVPLVAHGPGAHPPVYDDHEGQDRWVALARTAPRLAIDVGMLDRRAEIDEEEPHAPVRRKVERATGADLSAVQVHTDSAVTGAHDARAVAIDQEIFVDAGEDLASDEGEHLLAHELAHTLQARHGAGRHAAAKSRTTSTSAAEVEADRFADAVVAGHTPPSLTERLDGVVARKPRHHADPTPDYDPDAQAASIVASTPELTFDTTALGKESAPQTVTITNTGATPVTIQDVHAGIAGAAFPTYGALDGPIAAGASVDLQFAFRPAKEGAQSALYHIVTDGGITSLVLRLTGTGVSDARSELPHLKADPKQLELPSTPIGEVSATQTVTLTNTGREPIELEQFELAGHDAADFTVVGEDDGNALAPDASIQLGILFQPTPAKTSKRHATLRIHGNETTAARVLLHGVAQPRVKKTDADLASEDSRELIAAPDGVVPVDSYRDMLAAVLTAQTFTDQGNGKRAQALLRQVEERLVYLEPWFLRKVDNAGAGQQAVLALWSGALIVRDWADQIDGGGTIRTDVYVSTFEAAEKEIKLATGELREIPELSAANRYAAMIWGPIVAAPLVIAAIPAAGELSAGAAVTEGVAEGGAAVAADGAVTAAATTAATTEAVATAELGSVLAQEGALFAQSVSWTGAQLATWALANPASALALSELLLGMGIQIHEDGWNAFASQFSTRNGWGDFFWTLGQVAHDMSQLGGAVESDGEASEPTATRTRVPGADEDESPPAPTSRARDAADAGEPQQGSRVSAVVQSVLSRARRMADTIAQYLTRRDRSVEPSAPDPESEKPAEKQGGSEEVDPKSGSSKTPPPPADDVVPKDATPAQRKAIEQVLALDPEEGARLVRKYGDELTEYVRTNPVKSLKALETALDKQRAEVKTRTVGFYEGIDPDEAPAGWTFHDTEFVDADDKDVRILRTKVDGPNGAVGIFTRAYNAKTKVLELRVAFLRLGGETIELPSKVARQGDAVAMLKDETSPTVQYITLYQMKRLGVPRGDKVDPGVEKIHMSQIENLETIIHLHWLKEHAKGDVNDLIQYTASMKYAETTGMQTGYRRVSTPVVSGGGTRPIDVILEHQEDGNEVRIRENNALLEKYGYKRGTRMYMQFDIDFDVKATQ